MEDKTKMTSGIIFKWQCVTASLQPLFELQHRLFHLGITTAFDVMVTNNISTCNIWAP